MVLTDAEGLSTLAQEYNPTPSICAFRGHPVRRSDKIRSVIPI